MSTDDPQWASKKLKVIEQRLSEATGRIVKLAAEHHAAVLSWVTGDRPYRTVRSIEKKIEKEGKRKDKLERQRKALRQEEKRRQKQTQPVLKPAENLTPPPGNVLAGKKPENVREEQPERAYQSPTTSKSAHLSSAPLSVTATLMKAAQQVGRDRWVDRHMREETDALSSVAEANKTHEKQADVSTPLTEKLGLGKWADEMLKQAKLVRTLLRSGELQSDLRKRFPIFFDQVVDALPPDNKELIIKQAKTKHVPNEDLLEYLGVIKHLAGSTLAGYRKKYRQHEKTSTTQQPPKKHSKKHPQKDPK